MPDLVQSIGDILIWLCLVFELDMCVALDFVARHIRIDKTLTFW